MIRVGERDLPLRALAIWLGILVLANVNGAIRELVLRPTLGDAMARALSTLLLSAVVILLTWLTIRWIDPPSRAAATLVGVAWLLLTLTFEFGAGHYLFHKPWAELLADYDIRRGRIWVLALLVTLAAPVWAASARGLLEFRSAGPHDSSRPP
jgi:hypothetical protein